MKLKKILFAFSILGAATLSAQDIHFSQTTETPLLLNPSQAGLGNDVRAYINYKDQWRSVVSAPYKTVNASVDFAVLKRTGGTHLGVGVDLFNDKAGDANMVTSLGQLHVAGIVALNSTNLLSIGLSAGYGQRSMNGSALSWGTQYDGQQYNGGLPSGEPADFASFGFLDIGAGASWFFAAGNSTMSSKDAKVFNIGFSVQHLNKPAYSFYGQSDQRLPMKIVAHGNASIGLKNTNLIMEPSYFVAIQAGHHEIIPGMMMKYIFGQTSLYTDRKKSSALSYGLFFRVKDAIVPMLRYEYSYYSIAASYDFNVSGLTAASRARGGFEISLRYMVPNPFGQRSSRSLI
jgi:type IX secretion system PorP/SprF family membrane protein